MADALAGLDGIKVFIDDILVYGSGDNLQEAMIDHDKKVEQLFRRLKALNIKLNPEKVQYKKSQLKYMGHVISSEGVQIDEDKIRAIQEIKEPTNVKELRTLLGMVNYLAKFIENLSEKSHLLRELIKNDTKWNWTEAHSKVFQDLKKIIGNTKTLKYFNPQEPVTI